MILFAFMHSEWPWWLVLPFLALYPIFKIKDWIKKLFGRGQ